MTDLHRGILIGLAVWPAIGAVVFVAMGVAREVRERRARAGYTCTVARFEARRRGMRGMRLLRGGRAA